MAAWRLLPASWQTWSIWSATASKVRFSFVVSPRTQLGLQHPGVHHRPDHPVALDHAPDHGVVELAVAGHQRAAIGVAGQHRSLEAVERLVKTLVGEVGDVEHHPQFVHDA